VSLAELTASLGEGNSALIEEANNFKLAADQNHADAQFHYGICLRDGIGVSIDLIGA
jgi:TPR repeat protein